MRTMVAMRVYALSALVVAVSIAAPAAAQTGPLDPATTPAVTAPPPPIEPLPGSEPPPAGASPTVAPVPSAPPPSMASASPAPGPPIVERWWFWTAIGAVAVTAVVILAVSSGPSTPRTDLGNMPAF